MSTNNKRSVLITGCSSGIGLSIAKGLHTRGYRVFASCRKQQDCDQIEELGIRSPIIDLDCENSISEGVALVVEECEGQIFGLINNGAYGQPGAVEDLSPAALRAQFETNVIGTQYLTNLIIPFMRKNKQGRIVQISSVLGFVCLKYRGAYNASKYALEALTDTMRLELADTGIELSLIEPGPIESKFRSNAYKKFLQNIDERNSHHSNGYNAVKTRLLSEKPVKFTLPAEAVLDVTIHALESKRPKLRYRVTTPTKIFAVLKRCLPDRLLDRILGKT